MKDFSNLGKSQDFVCPSIIQDLPVTKKYKTYIIEESELCSNPAKYLCDESLNPNIAKDQKARDLFDQIQQKAEQDKRIKKFISNNSKNQGQYCFELSNSDYIDCVKLRNQIISKKIYTDKRKKIAQDLFAKAKKAILAVLKKRANILEVMGLEGTKSNLEEMKDEINEAQLFFGTYASDTGGARIRYNAQIKGLVHESQRKWYHLLTRGDRKNTVFLEGMILQADFNPEDLYFTLLHELAHFIDPTNFRGDDEYTENPFQKELKCLKRDDSVAAKPGHPDCFEAMAKKYEDQKPDFSRQLRETAERVQDNPDIGWRCPDFPKGEEECQMGQLGEAFADWMATEAFVNEQQYSTAKSKVGLYQRSTHKVINLQERVKKTPQLLKQIASYCRNYNIDQRIQWSRKEQKGSHPIDEDRLNGIILAHPLVKFSLGCSSKYVNNLKKLEASALKKGRVYCGKQLYLPFGAKK